MQRDDTFGDVLNATRKEWVPEVMDAYTCGLEDAYIAFTRANLIKPAHLGHAALLIETCLKHAQNQTDLRLAGQLIDGVDL